MLHSLWRRWNSRSEGSIPPEKEQIENHRESICLSFVEQKIHPNLNALAEEISSQGHEHMSENRQNDQARTELLEAEFVGLQPSTRRSLAQKEAHKKDNSSLVANKNQIIKDPNPSRSLSYDNVQESQKEHPTDTPVYDIPHTSSSVAGGVQPIGHSMSTSITRWSTFGRRTERKHATVHPTDPGTKVRSASKSASQSSLSQPQSHANSPSRLTSSDSQPQTPGSSTTHSFHTSTPYSRGNSSRSLARDTVLPSPNTFGTRTPMQSETKHGGSYFDFKEIPPPLPPLDHPAFKAQKESIMPSGTHVFLGLPIGPGYEAQRPGIGQFIRHATHSLPSLTGSIKKKNSRPRSKSTAENVHVSLGMPSGKVLHSRSQSKSSIASSRRSSAEYSAKQASSIGHESAGDGGWEIQVSRAMISLALGEGGQSVETKSRRLAHHDPPPSSFGMARGKNRSSGGVSRLGSPFLLQDSYTHKLTDEQLFEHPTTKDSRDPRRKSSERFSRIPIRNNVMSHGDSVTPPTSSSAKTTSRKGKENSGRGSPSPSGSYSRKGGRTLSSPSRTQTPSPPPSKLNTSTILGNVQGSSSLLQPPTLAVIAPTPEASPISPTRRTHHKSTPTMPTASVLRNPSAPPVIEKSYSSGSGKRKAEEAGVSGDKTPPKEPREPRATFAPDPRTHRTSATSGSSAHAPSSFNRSKRVRLSEASEGRSSSRSASNVGSLPTPNESPPTAKTTGSWSSKGSHGPLSASSHTYGYGPPSAPSASQASHYNVQQQLPPSRRSLSQASIPISALISPHAPSIGRTGTFHMRDPRKPSPIQSTPWSLAFPSQVQTGEARWGWRGWVERGGSPLHSWLFFIGFILFPLWWIAAFLPIPRTRRLGGTDAEKGVTLDDPQVEHDAKSWRIRCRFMAVVSLVTYIPFIVLVAVYA